LSCCADLLVEDVDLQDIIALNLERAIQTSTDSTGLRIPVLGGEQLIVVEGGAKSVREK